ncbi:MAG: ECF subfamily RNA polymerase sigma-24 factor [bacterium]|nr:MAG: ECF subfamily RNA polymerase sigma-24 factor [bacterium]
MLAAVTYLRPLPDPRNSIESLFQEHYDQVFRSAYRITGNTVDAEDVLQTVFLRVMRNQENKDLSPNPKSYLIRAAINAGLDIVRARSRARAKSISIEQLTEHPASNSNLNPQNQQEDSELRRQIQKAISTLGEKAAEVFVLRFLEGYENQEIAQLLGMSQIMVAVILHRARTKVRKELGQFLEVLK